MLTLDIGCGERKERGAIGVDRRPLKGVDVVCDFEQGLPFRSQSVAAVHLTHIIEHIRDLNRFMVELYRICALGARVYIRAPYYTSKEAFVDPTHVRFITEESFKYFEYPNYYQLNCHFRTVSINFKMRQPFDSWPEHFKKRARRYLWNVCHEIQFVLEAVTL
ncbi:methyltransferase domain-containing protein [Candidatus Nitrospira bockiana]